MLADSGSITMDVVVAFAAFAPFPILAVVGWFFWRAKKREEAAEADTPAPGASVDGAAAGRASHPS